VLNRTAPSKYFIPFPRDQLIGRVVGFDPVRGTKERENPPINQSNVDLNILHFGP
jgi:hypothetical protein